MNLRFHVADDNSSVKFSQVAAEKEIPDHRNDENHERKDYNDRDNKNHGDHKDRNGNNGRRTKTVSPRTRTQARPTGGSRPTGGNSGSSSSNEKSYDNSKKHSNKAYTLGLYIGVPVLSAVIVIGIIAAVIITCRKRKNNADITKVDSIDPDDEEVRVEYNASVNDQLLV